MRRRRKTRRVLALLALLAAIAVTVGVLESDGHSRRHHRATASRRVPTRHARPHPPRRVKGPHHRPVPILMYHVISRPKPGVPFLELYTPAPVFAAQMHALARRGYHAVTLGRVYRYWRDGYALPRKPIVLTFDDGYLSDYTHAAPVLRRLGWPGVLNLEIDNVRTRGDISPREVRKLIAAGWEVDSHTLTHPDLTTLSPGRVRHELTASRAYLRSHFGVPADFFCYPAGRFNAAVAAAVRRAGYRLATTTEPGLARPATPYALDRIRVEGQDGVAGLLSKLAHPNVATSGYSGG